MVNRVTPVLMPIDTQFPLVYICPIFKRVLSIIMKTFLLILLAAVLSACAQSSGILKMGPDTYSITAYASIVRGAESGAKRTAIKDATEYCTSQGKEILVTNISCGGNPRPFHNGAECDITFQCLDKNDPELKRPHYRYAPSAVIEDRR